MPSTAIDDHPHTLADLRARASQFIEVARSMMRQAEELTAAIERLGAERSVPDPLPERARVKIIGEVADATEVMGRTGVALAGGPTDMGWTYTVLVDGVDEAYILPRSVLQYLGDTIPVDHLYGGESLRVRVGEDGAGTIIERRSKKRSGSR